MVHHDLWDYDTAPQPVLATLRRSGSNILVVIQGSKTGDLFVLHRETGVSVFKVEERAVPRSDMDQETTSPTQPFPVAPPPLLRQQLSAKDAWGISDDERIACRERLEHLQSERIFTPPSVPGIVAIPATLEG